ncbi:PRC-barrel domain-containing protein [Bryobacter aggregatus]|uniref:PRC-barrel domain-containing protein n=1 Tax=Bryobacter aggregatus TaxID=360054 RepID=UPI0004E136F3|nr:PRC-barrel domain-containing protein [Bryobacter aggregatus]
MMTTTRKLKGLVVRATDGELGTVEDFYFDDETWGVRYLTLETGGWLGGRQVLISPIAVLQTDWSARRIDVKLTRRQIENSPSIDKHKPVSRQHEAQYMTYYGYPYYWDGPYLWGAAYYPTGLMMDPMAHSQQTLEDRAGREPGDSHLRSTDEVTGYHIHANDGEIGHVDQFVIDDEVWAIRYLEVATRNWWPGKKVLLSPSWVERVSWPASSVFVALSRKAIQTCPEYFEGMEITREYEKNIYCHYGRPPYWLNESENRPSVSSPTR